MIKTIKANINWIYILIPVALSLMLFFKSLSYYFFQDDFYELLISKANNVGEFLNLFKFLENRSSYRPIGLQLYFFISQNLFGLNPFFFRVVTFTFFFCSYFLIYKCVSKILQNKIAGIITAFFWVTSSIHYLSLSWIAAAWIQIGTFFFLLSLFLFLQYLEKRNFTYYSLAFLAFIVSAGSFEFFVALPLVFGAYLIMFANVNLIRALKIITPMVIVVIVYGLARLLLASLPQINEYKLEISPEALKNLMWYFFWTLNIPEEFKKQVITNLFVFNKTFISEFSRIMFISFTSLAIIVGFVAFSLFKSKPDGKTDKLKVLTYCISWFTIAITPVIFFPNHSFAMYLALPSIGIYMALAYIISQLKNKYVLLAVLFIWLFSSYFTQSFYKQIFWVVDSQEFAKKFSVQIQSQYPRLPEKAVLYFPLEDRRHRQAILNGDAVKVIYDNSSIETYFDKNSLDTAINLGIINEKDVVTYYEK